jgi:protein involved in polysaccharide export with SLBB domain
MTSPTFRVMSASLLLMLGMAACGPKHDPKPTDATVQAQPQGLYPTLADNPRPTADPYVLQVGDLLAIKFYTNPELNEDVRVRPDGKISLQLIDDVQAAGLTPMQLDADLTKRYTGELADPNVSVIVRETTVGEQIFVSGEVGKQGAVPLIGGLTLYQAIQSAGGFLETAQRSQVILIRKGTDGKPFGRAIDVRLIQAGESPESDVPMRSRDMVFVPRSKIANVDVFVKQYIRDALPVSALPIPAF